MKIEEKINKYLDKVMSLDEKREFEAKMKANPKLYEKVIEERDVRLLDRLLMHSQINTIINEQEEKIKKRKKVIVIVTLLTIILISAILYQYIYTQYKAQPVAKKLFEPYQSIGAFMGKNNSSQETINIGLEFYNKKEYSKAIEQFKKIPDTLSYFASVQFYLGNSYLALGEPTPALDAFYTYNKYAKQNQPFDYNVEFYIALAHLELGNIKEAEKQFKNVVQNSDNKLHKKQAQKALNQINSTLFQMLN